MREFKNLSIGGTTKTPNIECDTLTGDLILQGRSFPENAAEVYEPLVEWVDEYVKMPRDVTNFYLRLEYFNSSSLLWIIKIIKGLSRIEKEGSNLFFHLYFDDDDFDIKDADELKDVIRSIIDIEELKIQIGIKIHGTDSNGKVIDESSFLN
ncbi:MAG: hypothetical protein A2X05_16130 [Bacteroidetes bacterium GWE2_41_25]|nr:MAG: hypothetical protein A2X03_12445 [Bacteroidetes bacterium GWA2_40_15]OFX90957.1 MAG: hypothetical protein A2X05_16130 [Bacteroidetes bacterium GWE2_41_25]OFY00229.1 MAG: hypothetical protein A2X06_16855 [Bacteroidetes bacterium GWC2_40_22]OFY59180.1 MAG: hypothetical protein A2X04_09830 [Bacteroidetes bacterium GWF2_41_9]HBH84880.1 nuclear pore complex subunit [Bacteroidales bacterium]